MKKTLNWNYEGIDSLKELTVGVVDGLEDWKDKASKLLNAKN